MKKLLVTMMAILMVVACVLGVVACKEKVDKTNPLDTFSYEIKRYYEDDFTLPATIGDYELTWESDNSAIVLTKRADNWLATVVRPDEGTVEVTLKVTANGYSKEYKTSVAAIEVSDIVQAYEFKQNKATIAKDFALDQETTYKGKTATIVWTVEDELSKEFISISEDGTTCLVTESTQKIDVKIKATFTYGNDSSSKIYTMTVYMDMEGLQLVDYWYTNTGVSIDMSGYVVLIGTPYDANYGNVTLYMVNDDLTAGFYLYRVKTDAASAAKLAPGVHVTVTGTTNTDYNGLIETNAGGKLVVDDDIDPIDLSTTIAAVDELVLGDLPATVYNESRLVSLTGWTVKKIDTEQSGSAGKIFKVAGQNFTLMTLEKGGVEVDVRVSKYLEGAYKTVEDDATWKAICDLTETFPVGSVVNVTGIFSKYKNSWQIMPLSANDVTAGTADPAGTVYAGQTVAKAVAAVNAALKAAGADQLVKADLEFNLPTTSGDVTMAYTLCGASRTVVVDGNNISIKVGKEDSATIRVDYKLGDFETVQFLHIKTNGNVEPEPEPEEVFVASKAPYEEGKAYILAVDQGTNKKTYYALAEMSGDFLKTTEDVANAASLYVEKVGDNYRLYFDGASKSYISYRVGQNKNGDDTPYITLVTDQATAQVWTWDATNKCFKADLDIAGTVGTYYFGTYGTFDTISISKISYVATSFPAYLGEMMKASDVEPEPEPDEPIAEHAGTEADPFTIADVLAILETLGENETYSFNGNDTFYIKGYVITGTYNEQYKNFDGFTLGDTDDATTTVIAFRPKMAADVKLAEVGHLVVLKGKIQWYVQGTNNSKQIASGAEIVENLADDEGGDEPEPEPDPDKKNVTIAEAIALADGTEVVVTGYVISIGEAWSSYNNMSVTIKDEAGDELYIFRLATQVGLGDTITVTGKMATYNGARQIGAGATATIDEVHDACTEWTEADCTNAGKCVKCGKENPDMPALGHADDDNDGVCDRCTANLNSSVLATFDFGANGAAGHVDGDANDTYSDTNNGYTLALENGNKVFSGALDAMGNSCLKLGTSKVAGSFSFTVADDVKTVKIYIAKYKANNGKVTINGTEYTLNSSSNDGEYDCIEIDVSTVKTVTLEVTSGFRAMINTIEFWS